MRSTTSIQNIRPSGLRTSIDGSARLPSPNMPSSPFASQFGHRARQNSQGFFEPTLPHASSGRSASQIAAQAAMHHTSPPLSAAHTERQRSIQGLAPINTANANGRRPTNDTQTPQVASAGGPLSYSNGLLGGSRVAATAAANVAFPSGRSPLPSPTGLTASAYSQPIEKEQKSKSSKMKLFSKPKNLNLSREKDSKSSSGLPSPGKAALAAQALRNGFANASTTSLLDHASSASSLYSSTNASTSTLVPTNVEKERDKHRHNFLSRGKHKQKDEYPALPLSSAMSNSQATNPEKPQPLYSFTPGSPSAGSFAKTMSNFDLLHGGRALREKKKEEKAAAAAAKLESTPMLGDRTDSFSVQNSMETTFGPSSTGAQSIFFSQAEASTPAVSAQTISNIGTQMGLQGLGPDDVWPLLKARLLNLFSGEPLVRPIEELNLLVSSHLERCIRRMSPILIIEDLRDLLQTGFGSLAQTLRFAPDDRLVTKLVEIWTGVYGAIIPFLQAVFLPLDLEFKGKGAYMSPREAQEFWAAMPEGYKADERPSSSGGTPITMPQLGDELDIRRITLIVFRDTVIMPKQGILMAIFGRLSLDSINAAASPDPNAQGREHSRSDPAHPGAERPGTAGSLSPHMSSFNSQGSTLLDAASTSSGGGLSLAGRSRATSNTSAGSFGTNLPHLSGSIPAVPLLPSSNPHPSPPPVLADPAKVTDTVARMLQCLYVLASCQTGDIGQGVVERLTVALKYNWLGRGRTGRDRRGWVGMKTAQPTVAPAAA